MNARYFHTVFTFKLQAMQYLKEHINRTVETHFGSPPNKNEVLFEGFVSEMKILTSALLMKMKIFNGILL